MIRRLTTIVGAVAGHRAVWLAAVMCASSVSGPAASSVQSQADKAASAHGDIVRVRLGGDANSTRVVLELGKSVAGKSVSSDKDVKQQVIALPDISLKGGDMSGTGQGLVSGWKVENLAGSTRLKLNFSSNAKVYRRFLLPPADGISVYRYVVDIVPENGTAAPGAVSPVPVMATEPSSRMEVAERKRAKKIIVIDAGHGGKDPGAHGAHSLERDINLAAAKVLRDKLEKSGRYQVIMTRDTDSFVDLSARVRIARTADADLFISLHSDSGGDGKASGASIYTLSDSGTERAARKATVKGDWSLADLPSDQAVQRILVDLTQRATKNRSATFAQMVMDQIGGSTPLLKSSLRQAGFVVLLAPDVPAVLLEMGFVNNPSDEAMLNDSRHRDIMMGQVASAIDQYFDNDVMYASVIGTR